MKVLQSDKESMSRVLRTPPRVRPDVLIREINVETDLATLIEQIREIRYTDHYPAPKYPMLTDEDCADWLLGGESMGRWVGLIEGEVVGFIQLSRPRDYMYQYPITNGFRVTDNHAEIGKLFTAVAARGLGVGYALLQHARAFANEKGYESILAVLPDHKAAINLYERVAMRQVAEFYGSSGENWIYTD